MINITCQACGTTIRVRDDAVGRRGRCGKCHAEILVPIPAIATIPVDDDDDSVVSPVASPKLLTACVCFTVAVAGLTVVAAIDRQGRNP